MMSLTTIRQMSADAAGRAKAKGLRPIAIGAWAAESSRRTALALHRMPYIGDWRPANLKLVPYPDIAESRHVGPDRLASMACAKPYLLVDASGAGAMTEPALTQDEFVDLVRANPGLLYAIVEAGQSQVVVGVFRKRGAR